MRDVPSMLAGLSPMPNTDFSAFGPVELEPLSKIQRLTGAFLGRNWVTIPHVTHHDEVDVTTLEEWRATWNATHPEAKLTPVAPLVKAMAIALAENPRFNTALSADGMQIVRKGYVHIGVAVDTPRGLLVPVIRDADRKTVREIGAELAELAARARDKGLPMAAMEGGCITLSSLGHIGGTAFTPIINAPEVAVLGALAIQERPFRGSGGDIAWAKRLPLSLSYDHRVINGADAARFVQSIGRAFADPALLI